MRRTMRPMLVVASAFGVAAAIAQASPAAVAEPPIVDKLGPAAVHLVRSDFDPLDCGVLIDVGGATGGRIAGAITIEQGGDTYVADPAGSGSTQIYDCPPY